MSLSPITSPANATIPAPDRRGGGGCAISTGGGISGALSPVAEILDHNVFALSEPVLAAALGLPVRAVTNARVKKLARGRDWELDGNVAWLTEKSLPRLVRALDLEFTPMQLAELAQKSRASSRFEFPARVAKFPPNPKLITVCWLEDGLERVANIITNRRENFRIGMSVPVRLNPHSQRYELARPAPRQKGRW